VEPSLLRAPLCNFDMNRVLIVNVKAAVTMVINRDISNEWPIQKVTTTRTKQQQKTVHDDKRCAEQKVDASVQVMGA